MKSFLSHAAAAILIFFVGIGIFSPFIFSTVPLDEGFATELPGKDDLRDPELISDDENFSDQDTISETEISEAAQTAAAETPAPDPVKKVITGFEPLDPSLQSLTYFVDEKPTLNNLLKTLPKYLDVYINHESKSVSVPVIWYCVGDNYKSSDLFYFQFSPVFGDEYEIASYVNLLKDAPYILVSLIDDSIDVSDSLMHLSSDEVSANEQKVYRFLTRKMGLNTAAVCGIIANIRAESNFNPTFSDDTGTSYGICQWRSDRKNSLINWCRDNHHKYNTLSGQLYYLQYEISQNNREVLWNGQDLYDKLLEVDNTAAGAYMAGYLWCRDFEQPISRDTKTLRGNIAQTEFWKKYGTTDAPVSMKDCNITLSRTLYNYSGNACTPNVRVSNGSTILKIGSDYRLSYSDNVNPGTAAVTIIGIGDCVDSKTLRYTIRLKTPEITEVSNKVTGIQINWNPVDGASGYYILRRTEDTRWERIK